MKRFLSLSLVFLLALGLLCACGREKTADENVKYIYYMTTDKMGIVPIEHVYSADNPPEMLAEAIDLLCSETGEVDYIRTIPDNIHIEDFSLDSGILSIYFDRSYSDLDTYTEILMRAAIVKTILQIDGIDAVSFYVGDDPLQDSNGTAVGAMTADSFAESTSITSEAALDKADLKLYFASADGQTIVCEERDVRYAAGVSLEKVVLNELLKGPDSSSLQRAIQSGTKVLSVSKKDGTCYVNFNETFLNSVSGVSEAATVYSVVNSLTNLDGILEVQILVNGQTASMASIDISQPLSKNEDIISPMINGAQAGITEVME